MKALTKRQIAYRERVDREEAESRARERQDRIDRARGLTCDWVGCSNPAVTVCCCGGPVCIEHSADDEPGSVYCLQCD